MEKINVKTFKEMIELRERFAQNRHNEKVGLCDHQLGNSTKLAGTKQDFRKEIMNLQDGMNEKQHSRKMEQIKAVAKGKGANI